MKLGLVAARLACFLALAFLATPAAALWETDYDPHYGTSAGQVDFYDIDETSMTDPTPLYGEPLRIGNLLRFYPTAFASESRDGVPDTTQGKLRMRIEADEGYYLEQIVISEYGDYLLTGLGGAETQANIGGTLYVIDESPEHMFPTIIEVPLEVTPVAPPFTLPDSGGQFQAHALIDVTEYQWTRMYVILTNTLQTTSTEGTVSFIQKNVLDGPVVDVRVIPEPGSLCLLALGAMGALIRKRKAF